jgi:hypothetical protein
MPTIDDIAHDFTIMLRAGKFAAAGERYWATDVRSVEPHDLPGGIAAIVVGSAAVLAKTSARFGSARVDEIGIDGPFITGDQFALFIDMMVTSRTGGTAVPFTEIAVFTVRDAKIAEERYFYE